MEEPSADTVEKEFLSIQSIIKDFLVEKSNQHPIQDRWSYERGTGGGLSIVWEGKEGSLLEKGITCIFHAGDAGGVNFSGISGVDLPSAAVTQLSIPAGTPYRATGAGDKWWFGGGIDLTPYYPDLPLIIEFHRRLKQICEESGQPYEKYKAECDEYFTLKHRNEMRGVGGIFFDHLMSPSKRSCLDFVLLLGRSFPTLYAPFIDAKRAVPYTPAQRQFQLLRRGRYVEFNLIYDRGTKFGLMSGGRTESILMSLPATATWQYNWKPDEDSDEAKFSKVIYQPLDWAAMSATDVEKLISGS